FEVLNDGAVVLFVELDDAARGIWLWSKEDGLKKMVIEGDPVPGYPEGATFSQIRQIAAGDRHEVAFTADLTGPGIGFTNDNGAWLATTDDVKPLVVASDVVQIDGQPAVVGFVDLPNQVGTGERTGSGADGRPSVINENGDVVLHVYFNGQPDAALLLAVRGGLVVNSTGDDDDDDPNDGVCDTGRDITRQSGSTEPECTLRAAIQEANQQAGQDDISFDIDASGSVPMISVMKALPTIQDPIIIDGTTQPGGLVRIDGASLPGESDGLVAASGGSTLRGLIVTRFGGNGIVFTGENGNRLFASFIGTDGVGTQGLGNGDGLRIERSSANFVGGDAASTGNVISGNLGSGIRITLDANANLVQGNFVGVDRSGEVVPNAVGVDIFSSGYNIVGGGAGMGNVISGNTIDGVRIQSEVAKSGAATEGNEISGNIIGSDASGLENLGNTRYGVNIEGGINSVVGGSESGEGNLIVGNGEAGIRIRHGSGTEVLGNRIGVNADLAAIPNLIGILIDESPSNLIGNDNRLSEPNVIAGNDSAGVAVIGESSDFNRIRKNAF
ncbi:MAG: CSLREA domain-containing protein, partial [Rhodothermales bacterium]